MSAPGTPTRAAVPALGADGEAVPTRDRHGRVDPVHDVPGRPVPVLDAGGDVVALTAALVDIASVSGAEQAIADAVQAALAAAGDRLEVRRLGNVVVARTALGRPERAVLAGHLDTVPAAGNAGARRRTGHEGPEIAGLGSVDMKGGVAVALHLAVTLTDPIRDLTAVFYDCEEVESARNGLGRLAASEPGVLAGDLAILLEPTGGLLEGGCQGSLHVRVSTTGRRAHSARAWTGENAVHALGPLLVRIAAYVPEQPVVDGLEYREGLQAVGIEGGVAGNVVPDAASVRVNFRYAPHRNGTQALAHVREVLAGYDVDLLDDAPAARPRLDAPAVAALAAAIGTGARAKYGWTDVARFAALGIPAVNLGPGDPSRSHTADEAVPESQIRAVEAGLRAFLSGPAPAPGRGVRASIGDVGTAGAGPPVPSSDPAYAPQGGHRT